MQVMDTQTGKLVGDIPNTSGVHGAALVPSLGKGYTSNGRDNSVTVFDYKTLKTLKTVKVGNGPDAIFYDSASKRVFTFNARSTDATAIDTKKDTVVGTVKVAGKPEFPQVDGKGKLYVNIEDKSTIQEIDTKALKVTAEWSIKPGEEASGLAIDTKNHVLFSTAGNNIMAVSDYKSKKVVGSPKIGNGPDAADFDPAFGLAFASNGQDGTISVVSKTAKGYETVETVKTMTSARTMILDPKTHLIYLIAAEMKPAAGGGRGSMVPGSAVILVVGPGK